MHKYGSEMPKVDHYMHKLYEACKKEWFATREGMRYKQQYDQMMQDIDEHVLKHMEAKYGHMD